MGVSGLEYGIAALGGAAEGFFDNQARENAEAKAQEQMERQAKLLMMKEERQQKWEALKQENQQSFEMRKQKSTQTFEMDKFGKEQEIKKFDAQAKRAQDIVDKADSNDFELKKMGIQHGNAVELETLKEGKKSTKDTLGARTELRKLFEKARVDAKKDQFGDTNQPELKFESWAQETYPELVEQAYPDGLPGAAAPSAGGGGSKFQSIFSKVTGSRTKQGANDGVEEPAPISVDSTGGVTPDPLPMKDTLQSAVPDPKVEAATAKVEEVVTSDPASADVGQILGLFAKGLVNVGSMSIEGLKALKTALESTGDVSRSMTEPYRQLSAEVGQAIIDAGGEMIAPVPYEQKKSLINQSKTKPQRGNLL